MPGASQHSWHPSPLFGFSHTSAGARKECIWVHDPHGSRPNSLLFSILLQLGWQKHTETGSAVLVRLCPASSSGTKASPGWWCEDPNILAALCHQFCFEALSLKPAGKRWGMLPPWIDFQIQTSGNKIWQNDSPSNHFRSWGFKANRGSSVSVRNLTYILTHTHTHAQINIYIYTYMQDTVICLSIYLSIYLFIYVHHVHHVHHVYTSVKYHVHLLNLVAY